MENPKIFTSKVTFCSNSSDINGKKLLSSETYFVLKIPQEILIYWHDLKAEGLIYKYANLIAETQVLPFKLVGNSALEKRINDAACLAIRECRGKSGRKKQSLLKKTRSVNISEEEVQDVRTITELENKCSELQSELQEARENVQTIEGTLNNFIEENGILEKQNVLLAKQLEDIDKPSCQNCATDLKNTSRKLYEVGTRQRQRKVL